MVRQILGAVLLIREGSLIAKLRGARDRKRAAQGKCEGRKSHAEVRPETVALARRLPTAAIPRQARGGDRGQSRLSSPRAAI